MQHAGFLKNDRALANVDAVAAFDSLNRPVFAVKIASHGFEAGLRYKYFFGLAAFYDGFKCPSMVKFHVVADDVVNFFGLKHLSDAAQQRAFATRGNGVEQNVFFVLDQIGVVGRAVRRPGIPVEIPVVVIDKADPEYIFFNFYWLHGKSPQCWGIPVYENPRLALGQGKAGESSGKIEN